MYYDRKNIFDFSDKTKGGTIMNKIYLAGFDVFYEDAISVGERLKSICSSYGLQGIFPTDNSIKKSPNATDLDISTKIFHKNISLIDQSDILVSNLNCFRGPEPDSGTCFEVGYAYAQGKKLYGYIENEMKTWEKIEHYFGEVTFKKDGTILDKNNLKIENFGLPVNLMLSVPVKIVHGSFEDCIKQLNHDLQEIEITNRNL